VESFDKPDIDFWNRIANVKSMGSGEPYLSGWITAFAFWTSMGAIRDSGRSTERVRSRRSLVKKLMPSRSQEELELGKSRGKDDKEDKSFTLVIDGQRYPYLYGIPDDCRCEVPVELDDNGVTFDTTMATHHVTEYFPSKVDGPLDSIRMQPVWMIYAGEGVEREKTVHRGAGDEAEYTMI
jgi:hypothetical protein